jgi:hypothetical protein
MEVRKRQKENKPKIKRSNVLHKSLIGSKGSNKSERGGQHDTMW